MQDHQVEDRRAEADDAEDDPEENQREGNREADADTKEKSGERDKSEGLRAHDGHSPLIAACMLLMNSETPCIISKAPVTGMTALKG